MSTQSRIIDISEQRVFFEFIDKDMISEMVSRMTPENEVLEKHITNELRAHGINNVDIRVDLDKNMRDSISFYINFLHGAKSYAHISFHLTDNKFKATSSGPIHLKLDLPKYSKMPYVKIFPSKNTNTLKFKYYNHNLSPLYKKHTLLYDYPEFQYALNILTRYFTQGDPYYLHNRIILRNIDVSLNDTTGNVSTRIGAIDISSGAIYAPTHPYQYGRQIINSIKTHGYPMPRSRIRYNGSRKAVRNMRRDRRLTRKKNL
jgi:hypothetical protein